MTAQNNRPGCFGTIINLFVRRKLPRWPAAGSQRTSEQRPAGVHPLAEREAQSAKLLLPTPGPLPYRMRDDFLSAAEVSFFHLLRTVTGDQAVVLTKIRLGDLFYVPRAPDSLSALGRIAQKHLDFLLCNPRTMTPMVGIELDDASHAREDRQARDTFVNQVFETAGLPLLHFAVRHAYHTGEVAQRLAPYLGEAAAEALEAMPTGELGGDSVAAPLCPNCGIPMVVRTAARGEHRGEQFYGCSNYPQCRARRPYPLAPSD